MTSDDRALEYLAAANPVPDPESVPLRHPEPSDTAQVDRPQRPGVIAPAPRPVWVAAAAFAVTAIAIGGITWALRGSPGTPATQSTITTMATITTLGATSAPPTTLPAVVTPPVDAPLRIMPIADAVTTGSNSLQDDTATYRCFLDGMLREAGIPFDFVGSQQATAEGTTAYRCDHPFDLDHEAYAGGPASFQYTIPTLSALIPRQVEVLQPDVALVHLGTFDLTSFGMAEPAGGAAEVAASLEAFVRRLQEAKPDLTILVAQVVPCVWTGRAYCEDGLREFNDLVASIGDLSTESSMVVAVDMYSGFDPHWIVPTGYRIHPSDEGDRELAARWFTALREAGLLDGPDRPAVGP